MGNEAYFKQVGQKQDDIREHLDKILERLKGKRNKHRVLREAYEELEEQNHDRMEYYVKERREIR